MRLLSVLASMLLVSTLAFGASTKIKKVKRTINDDGSVTTTTTESSSRLSIYKARDTERFVRRIMPTIGLNIADTTIKTSGMRTGFGFGGLMDLWGQHEWVLETGVLYRQLGTSNQGTTLALNYINVPISAKYYFMGQNSNTIYFKGGITPGFNVAATQSTDTTSTNVSKDVNTFDVGVIVGIGGRYLLSDSASIFLEGNYNRGLANVMNTTDGESSVNTLAFGVMTGVSIEL